jgi:hypothetical protein
MSQQYVFGDFIDIDEITPSIINDLLRIATEKKKKLLLAPVKDIIDYFGRLSDLWMDPLSDIRKEALEILPLETGLSQEMVTYAIDRLAWSIEAKGFHKKLTREIGDMEMLDNWKYDGVDRRMRYHPLGVLLHVISGNVLVGGAFSLAMGCITKNVNIIKTSSSLQQFPLLFAKSVYVSDTENIIRDTFSVINWKGGNKDIEQIIKQSCDGFIVWGGEDVVQNYRVGRRNSSRLVEFGPKVSLGIVTLKGWEETDKKQMSSSIARDISLWDQQSCSSPQVIFVESENVIHELAQLINIALSEYEKVLPRGTLTFDEEAELCREREVARFEQSLGQVEIITQNTDNWSIIIDYTNNYRLSPLKRSIYLKLVTNLSDFYKKVTDYKDYLQTIGYCVSKSELDGVINNLVLIGATRISQFGKMVESNIDDPHDGAFATNYFTKVVGVHFLQKK